MMTNRLFLNIAVLTTAAALTACSADEMDSSSVNPLNGDVISLTSRVAQTRAASELQTNALNTATKVGVFGISGTKAVTNGENNQYSVTEAGELKAVAKDMKWPSEEGAKVNIYAYAPYQSSWTYNSANTFSVAADQSTGAGYLSSDLLYASTTNLDKTKDAVVLAFSHKLARINVKLTKSEDCTFDVSKSVITLCGTKVAASLNPSTGALGAASGDATDIKIGADVTITADGTTTYGIVVPQTLAAGSQFVKIEADGKVLSAKLASAVTLEAGKAYNFNAEIGNTTNVKLSLGSATLTGWSGNNELEAGDIEEVKYEYSPTSFVALSGSQNATYATGTYTWTASTNNLMTILQFPLSDGHKLSDFETLEITVSNLTDGAQWRVGYVPEGGSYTHFTGSPSSTNGKLTIDLTALSGLSNVTKIQLGGSSNASAEAPGSLKIMPSDVVLKGLVSSTGDSPTPSTSGTLTATFGTPGSNATYASPTYSWTATNNNLMTCFEFSNGELDNYKTLTFKLSNLSGNMVRMGYYVGSTFTEFGNGYGSNGTKTVDLTTLGIDLKTVTKIAFGGRTGTGSVDILASEVVLSK